MMGFRYRAWSVSILFSEQQRSMDPRIIPIYLGLKTIQNFAAAIFEKGGLL